MCMYMNLRPFDAIDSYMRICMCLYTKRANVYAHVRVWNVSLCAHVCDMSMYTHYMNVYIRSLSMYI